MSRVPDSREGPDPPTPDDRPAEAATLTSIGDVLARARPANPAGLEFAQARMAADLFGVGEAPGVGRFQLLNRLGSGGMGVIYAAHDPQLDRTVALKVVHVPGAIGESALVEARALARLSHPNVVPIFDVGITGEHLYLVMELVLGRTLGRWAKGHTQREIRKAFVQAGEALAAAHAAGLVHRDFKPDNAIMGNDGRVRVVDFGLACEAEDPDNPKSGHRRGGTPKYMAVEQRLGLPITAATDQHGFCVALAETLKENLPQPATLPRWLQAVIDRGSAPDPADRFPSMTELLRVLSRDPVLARRRRLSVAAVAVAAAASFVAVGSKLSGREAACNAGESRLAAVWGPGGRAQTLARIARMGDYGRSLQPRLEQQLADHARRWTGGYRDACLAHDHGVQSDALLDRRMACLERGRAALTAVVDLVQTADAKALPDLVLATQALPDPDGCGDLQALLANAEPPPTAIAARVADLRGRIAAVRVQIAAGRLKEARALAEQVAKEARSLGYRPLLAETLVVQGHATMTIDDRSAVALLTEAFALAFEAGNQSLAVEAWARRAWTQGLAGSGPASLAGLDVVEAAASNKSVSAFARALLYNNVGAVEFTVAHRDRARVAFEHALREARGVTGPGAAELLTARVNLGWTTDDPHRRDQILAEAEAELARALGEDHPETLGARWLRARRRARLAEAAELMPSACKGLEVHNTLNAMNCWAEVGFVRRELDDMAGAIAAMNRSVSLQVEGEPPWPASLPYLHLWQGKADTASSEFAAALAAIAAPKDEEWWNRYEIANLELGLARAYRAADQLREAKKMLFRSLDRLLDIATKHPDGGVDRRLGRAHAELAEVLAMLHARSGEIVPHAAAAADWLRQAGGSSAEIQELDRLAGR